MSVNTDATDAVIIDRLLGAIPDVRAIYVFGSEAAGKARPDSDIDIAFLPPIRYSPVDRFAVAADIAAALHRDVDLVDLRSATTVMRMQVITRGRRLYAADRNEITDFEDFAFYDYVRLNEERAGILNDIVERGYVHDR